MTIIRLLSKPGCLCLWWRVQDWGAKDWNCGYLQGGHVCSGLWVGHRPRPYLSFASFYPWGSWWVWTGFVATHPQFLDEHFRLHSHMWVKGLGYPLSFPCFAHMHNLTRVCTTRDSWYVLSTKKGFMMTTSKPNKWKHWHFKFLYVTMSDRSLVDRTYQAEFQPLSPGSLGRSPTGRSWPWLHLRGQTFWDRHHYSGG